MHKLENPPHILTIYFSSGCFTIHSLMDSILKQRAIGLSIALFILVADQVNKWWLLEEFIRPKQGTATPSHDFLGWLINAPDRLPAIEVPLTSFFNIVMVWNEGVTFGLFQGSQIAILVGFSLIICLVLVIWIFNTAEFFKIVALALVIGGALGNVLDRIRFGAVADFFDFYIGSWHWPAFNIADSAITLGVAFLLFDSVFLEPQRQQSQQQEQ